MTTNQGRVPSGVPTGGQFSMSQKAESNIGLIDPFRPMSAAEFHSWGNQAQALRLLDTHDNELRLSDGSTVTVAASDSNLNGYVDSSSDPENPVGLIVEEGQYSVQGPGDARAFHAFSDLTERGQVGDRIAQNAVLSERGEGARLDVRTGDPIYPGEPEEDVSAFTYQADGPEECAASGLHLRSVDEDGYCNACGHQDVGDVEPVDGDEYEQALADLRDKLQDEPTIVSDPGGFWDGTEVIHAYSRADAIRDGVLKDYSELGRQAGIRWPVAVSQDAYGDAIAWTRGVGMQDEEGRAWDVVWMARHAVGKFGPSATPGTRVPFTVYRIPNQGRGRTPQPTTLHLHVGPGDDGQPVFTIMTEHED